MDINVRVPAIEKLLDYVASGIGSIAGPMLAPWKAGREADVNRILARSKADELRILASGQSDALKTIRSETEDARKQLNETDGVLLHEISLIDSIEQRIQFQEKKRQQNIGSVIGLAAKQLEDKSVDDHEPDHDFTARFFNDVQDVTSEEMKLLWSRILAGEVESPGCTSIRTLGILKNLDRTTAELFKKLCSVSVSLKDPEGNQIIDARAISLGGNASTNSLQKYGLDFGNLNLLNEYGLIISDYNSWRDYILCVGMHLPAEIPKVLYCPFQYQNKYWILSSIDQTTYSELKLHGVALTRAGRELSRVVDIVSIDDYDSDLKDYFANQKLGMLEVDSHEWRSLRPQV